MLAKKKKNRIGWIDYLKAFACFLVVLGHLLQSLQRANIDSYQNITIFINWFIYLFHMPLFMCMSGILYLKTKKEFSWKDYKKFEIKKIVNLIVPYITFYFIYIGINVMFASSVNDTKGIDDVLGVFNNPIPPYWFLYALMSIFIVVPLLEHLCKNNSKIVFSIFVILKIISIFFSTNIYLIDSIMRYAIYFYFGYFFTETKESSKKMINILLVITYVAISIGIYIVKDKINSYIYNFILILFAITGIYICISIFKNIKKSITLDTFKNYTFQIYLVHTIFAAGIRIVLLRMGVTNYLIHFAFGLIFSIYIPVLMSMISNKILYTNFFFYPIKTIEEIKKRKQKNHI